MAYEWPKNLLGSDGIPYEKKAGVHLERTDEKGDVVETGDFITQATVDEAWATGFHTPGKPETRDVEPWADVPGGQESQASEKDPPEIVTGPPEKHSSRMSKSELIALAASKGAEVDPSMTNAEIRAKIDEEDE